jgi:excisionase family DNA binding protein
MNSEPWIDCFEAAKHLGCTPEWLRANLKKLDIPNVTLGRRYRFRKSELDKWLLENMAKLS